MVLYQSARDDENDVHTAEQECVRIYAPAFYFRRRLQAHSACLLEDVVFVSRPTYKALLIELPQDRGHRSCVTSEFEVTVKCQTSIWFLRGCVYWL